LLLRRSQPALSPGLVCGAQFPMPKPGKGSRRRLGDPEVSGSSAPPTEAAEHDCIKGPPCRCGADPTMPVCSRLTGHSGRLWRVAGLAHLGGGAVAVTYDALTFELIVSVTSATPHEAAPRRASSPPWPPRKRNPDRFRQNGTKRPHPCTRGCGALRPGSATFAETGPTTDEGDARIDDAQVWRVRYVSGAADSSDHVGVHGGLDARLDAGSICPTMETCPTGTAHGDRERDRHRAAFERHPRNGSDSPQSARMAGEAKADDHWGSGPRAGKGTLAIVFRCFRRR
jgi:hypothetical protein